MLGHGIILCLLGTTLAVPAPIPIPKTPEEDDVFMHLTPDTESREEERATYTWAVEDQDFWNKRGEDCIKEAVAFKPNTNPAKNVILFIGDGMSTRSHTLRRDLNAWFSKGNMQPLTWDKFPYTGWAWTYNVDSWVTDSASSANAYLCGVKARQTTLGVTGAVRAGYCADQADPATHNPSIINWFLEDGRKAGVVTTATITHASPAAGYAHSAFRLWESDYDRDVKYTKYNRDDPSNCTDIATQLVRNFPGRDISVVMGGGRAKFHSGRKDKVDLIAEWTAYQSGKGNKPTVALTRDELLAVDPEKTSHLFAPLYDSYFPYANDRVEGDVSFKDMVSTALKVLQKNNDKGFFLFAEAGKVDIAHHFGSTKRAMGEMQDLDDAVAHAVANTDPADTLIIVTADHGHTLKMAGYPDRDKSPYGPSGTGADGVPYPMLNYAIGPGAGVSQVVDLVARRAETDYDTNPDFLTFAGIPSFIETHGGDDVPIYASGPRGYLLTGSRDNSYIAHAMAYAASVGPYKAK